MDKKIAVHCPTEDEWEKVQKKAFSEGWSWIYDKKELKPFTWRQDRRYICFNYEKVEGETEILTWYNKEPGYTILSASDYLAYGLEGRAFEVGDEVEVVKDGYHFNIGDIGKVTTIYPEKSFVRIEVGDMETGIEIGKIKLIKKEISHTVPLRVGDSVRALRDCIDIKKGDIGVVLEKGKVTSSRLHVRWDNLTTGHSCDGLCEYRQGQSMESKDLELIPTEADITVGSVWECFDGTIFSTCKEGTIRTIKSVDKEGVDFTEGLGFAIKANFLKCYKLKHRGDGESCNLKSNADISINGESFKVTGNTDITWVQIDEEPKQTNKKEKKMKRAEKVIKVGMLVVDRECSNNGRVEAIYEKQDVVTYTDLSDDSVHTVDISRLYIPLVMPKEKPVVKKKVKK